MVSLIGHQHRDVDTTTQFCAGENATYIHVAGEVSLSCPPAQTAVYACQKYWAQYFVQISTTCIHMCLQHDLTREVPLLEGGNRRLLPFHLGVVKQTSDGDMKKKVMKT